MEKIVRYLKIFSLNIQKLIFAQLFQIVLEIHAVCIALGLNKDHEVIVPAQTHVATAHAAAITGAKVRFADIDYKTGNILFSEIKKLTNKKTKCLIVVHMTGLSCEMGKIASFCRKKKIFLIEDCAHGLGTTYKKNM